MPTGRTTVAYDPEAEAARQAELAKQAQFAGLMTPSMYSQALFVPPEAEPAPDNYIPGSTYVPPTAQPEPYLPSSTYDPALSPSAYQPQNPYTVPSEVYGGPAPAPMQVYENPGVVSVHDPAYGAVGGMPTAIRTVGTNQTTPTGVPHDPLPPAPSTLYGGPSGMLPSRPDQIQSSYPAGGLYNNPLNTRQPTPAPYDESQPSNPYAVDRFAQRMRLADLYRGAGEPQFQPPPISTLGMMGVGSGAPGVPAYAQQPSAPYDYPEPNFDVTQLPDWAINRAGGIFGGIGNLLFPAQPAYAQGTFESGLDERGMPKGGGGGGRGLDAGGKPATAWETTVDGRTVVGPGGGNTINARGGVGQNPYGPRPTLTQQARANYTPPPSNPGMQQAIGSGYGGAARTGVGGLARGYNPPGTITIPGGGKGIAAAAGLGSAGMIAHGLGLVDNVQVGGGSTPPSANPYGVPWNTMWDEKLLAPHFPGQLAQEQVAPATTPPAQQRPAPATSDDQRTIALVVDADGHFEEVPAVYDRLVSMSEGGRGVRMMTPEIIAALRDGGVDIPEAAARDLLLNRIVVTPPEWEAAIAAGASGSGSPSVADAAVPTGGTAAAATASTTDAHDNGSYGGGYDSGFQNPEHGGYGGGDDLPPLPAGFGTGGGMFPGGDDDGDSMFAQMMDDPMFARYFEIFNKAFGPDKARLFMRRFGRNFKGMDRSFRSTSRRGKFPRGKRTPSLATDSASAERTSSSPDNAQMQKAIRRDVAKRTGTKKSKDEAS